MGVIEPTNVSVKSLKGLHLYHYNMSNCSMRVRITLEEKGLNWESHHIDLFKKENHTPEYFGINPNGLVPTLVHDGVVIIESNDIIDYLDQTFPDPPLRPSDESELERMYFWLEKSASIHVKAIKTHIYEKSVAGKMAHSEEEEESYKKLQTNPELLEFHRKTSANEFTEEEFLNARNTIDSCFREAETQFADSDWLAGSMFSLADISWMPLHFTLKTMAKYDFEPFPRVRAWADRISQRNSYQRAIVDWRPAR